MPADVQPVRPLDVDEREPRHPPPLLLVIVLLAVGGLIGWATATLGDDGIAPVAPAPDPSNVSPLGDALRQPAARPTITWVPATSVPAFPESLGYAGSTNVAEVNGILYLVIRYRDAAAETAIRNELWSSADGVSWTSDVLDTGMPVAITAVTAAGNGLLLTGQSEGFLGLWHSIPDRAINGTSWSPVAIDFPAGFTPEYHATVANRRGEVITTALGNLDVWREVVAPYVPDGVDVTDPDARMADNFLYVAPDIPLQLFSEPPEVVATDDSIWIRLVTLDGEEVLQTLPLPVGAYPLAVNVDLAEIPIAMSWRSSNTIDFLPVVGRNALPSGYFLPVAWQDGFVAASYEFEEEFGANGRVGLWSTAKGLAWRATAPQPPRDCSPFFLAVSRDRILLTAEDGTRCVGTDYESWTVLAEPSTVSYAVGGGAGFLGYPNSFDYATASFSRDGVAWMDVSIPATEPYPTLALLEDRLFAMSVTCCDSTRANRIEIWIGEIS